MSKILFIGPGFIVEIMGMPAANLAIVQIDLNGLKLDAEIEFHLSAESGKPESKRVTPVLAIKGVPGQRLPIDQLHKKTGEILQNYEAFARVLGGAYLAGFLKNDPE